jgi:ferrous iron transport protein B
MNSEYRILLVGNPNCGKSTLFNHLTNLNQKTGNFSGVTVEKRSGTLNLNNKTIELIDLPGSFSLNGISEDKKALTRFLMKRESSDKILFIMDSALIERSMQFFLQIADLGAEIILVLTMRDILEKKNINLDIEKLKNELNIKIIYFNGKTKEGLEDLKELLVNPINFKALERKWEWDTKKENFIKKIILTLNSTNPIFSRFVLENSLKKESGEVLQKELPGIELFPGNVSEFILNEFKISNLSFTYQDELMSKSFYIKKLIATCIIKKIKVQNSTINSIDKILLHPIYGVVIFLILMGFIFQGLFSWSEIPMDFIEWGFDSLSTFTKSSLPEGPLSLLIADGIIKGAGSVMVFVPQIALLFFFIGILEESGYMSRASFVMDKFMGKFGLSGKSFIPLLSSAACAVPAIMGSRTIENKSDRMTTILISPLITCSARYPVYILLIGTIFEDQMILGIFSLKGLMLFLLFFLGMITALIFALIFKNTFFKNESSYFLMEIPEYRTPSMRHVLINVYLKVKAFIVNSGTIIVYISIILWFLATYPMHNKGNQNIILNSYAAEIGKKMEPVIEPLGFDWKIGISLITSFAAREVMVSTLAIIYEVESKDENSSDLKTSMQNDINPKTGKKVWSTLSGISVLIFFAYACQCMSTLAVVRKETNSYIWPIFLFFYMTTLAYVSSLIIYQVGTLLGFG